MIPLLRLPGFDSGFFLNEESFYLLAAEKLAHGGHLYSELWHPGPPMMIWLYRFIHSLFGAASLTAIRVLACLYLYITAVYFAATISQFKPFRKFNGLSAVLLVLLCSVPWYSLQVSSSFFILLPISAAFFSILQLGENSSQNNRKMFSAGIWLMICTLSSYKFIFLLLGLLVAYLILKSPRLAEVMSLLGGMLMVLFLALLVFFYAGSLASFWDVGILYFLDLVFMEEHLLYEFDVAFTLKAWLWSWGGILLLAIAGFFHFRVRFFSYLAQIRSIELTMAVWLVSASLMLAFKYSSLELADFLVLAPPLSFYATKSLEFALAYRFRFLILPAIFIPAMLFYLGYWGLAYPQGMSAFYPEQHNVLLHGGQKDNIERSSPLHEYAFQPQAEKVWIMAFRPNLYQSFGFSCENKYLDFRILWYKLPLFGQNSELTFSAQEKERVFFQEFARYPPAYILDPHENFSSLQARYPGLFGAYKGKSIGEWMVYEKAFAP
jgi:hypothetical protein